MRGLFCILMLVAVVIGCSKDDRGYSGSQYGDPGRRNDGNGGGGGGGPAPGPVHRGSETVQPYLKCKAQGGHPVYPLTIVQYIHWMEGYTPRMRFRFDIIDNNGNVSSFDPTGQPVVDNSGISFRFSRGGRVIDYRYISAGFGTTEISENGGPAVRITCD